MTVRDLLQVPNLTVVNEGNDLDIPLTGTFCCDLLSICMSRATVGCAWVTVMGNINAVAVAVLTEAACIVLAEQISLDEPAMDKARQQGVTVFKTALPIFEAAKEIDSLMHREA